MILSFTEMAEVLELTDFYKETNAKTRAPDSLKRGQEYLIKKLYRVRSKYPDKDQQKPIKLVATFEQYKITWCVFMPKSFDNMDQDVISKDNESIEAKENIRLVYYGKAGNEKMVKILKQGEGEGYVFYLFLNYNLLSFDLCFIIVHYRS